MIEKVRIGTRGPDSDELTSPPARMIEVQVLSGLAYLGVVETNDVGVPDADITGD